MEEDSIGEHFGGIVPWRIDFDNDAAADAGHAGVLLCFGAE